MNGTQRPQTSSQARNRGLALLTSALLAGLAGGACGKDPPPTQPPTPTVAEASEPEAGGACRDWSDLDVASLPALPDSPHAEVFQKVWVTVLEKHYDPTLGCLDWPAIRTEYGEKIAAVKGDGEVAGHINEMLGRLGQSHLRFVPGSVAGGSEPRNAIKTGRAEVPIRVRMLGDDIVVVDPASDGGKGVGIPGGARIVSIDGEPLADMIASQRKHHGRPIESSFWATRIAQSWLSCPQGATKAIEFEAVGAKKAKTKKVACTVVERETTTLGNMKNVPIEIEHRMLEGTKIGYVRFNIWMLPLVPKIQAAVTELRDQGMTALVLDLRGNPGGVGAMVVPVGRLLVAEDTDFGTMTMRQGKQTFAITAEADPFAGPVGLLVDEGTASTSEIFGQAVQDLGRATVFGAGPSQGAALPSLIEELPGGAILQYVVADFRSPKDVVVEGKGVVPDTLVTETPADFAAGRDPVLDAAIEALSKEST